MSDLPSWVVPFTVSFLVCGLMVLIGPRDAPDGGRKTQARAVPSSGGVGIAVGHLLALGFGLPLTSGLVCHTHWLCGAPSGLLISVAAGSLIVLAIGLWDDLTSMPPSLKLLLLQAVSVVMVLTVWWLWDGIFPDTRAFSPWSVPLALGGALWLFVVMNATNFMDGSNGLALGCAAIMIGVLGWLFAPSEGLLPAILAFLVFNLTGRLYAGDAGAFYVGYWVGGLALMGAFIGHFSIWIPPLIALPFLTDVFMTLIWRARRGEHLMQAHRDHAYQLFRRAGWGHLQVAVLWWAMTAFCGALAIWAVNAAPRNLPYPSFWIEFATFAGALVVSIILWLVQRAIYGSRVSAPG